MLGKPILDIMKRLKPISYQVIYNRNKRLNKRGVAPISIYCYQNGYQKIIPTGISIAPKYWDNKRLKVKRSHPKSELFNLQINRQVQAMENYESEMIRRYGEFSVKRIEQYIDYRRELSFSCFFKNQLEQSNLCDSTIRTRRTTLKKLLAYHKGKNVYFSDLTFRFIKGFNNYLFRVEKLSTNTIHKHHKNIGVYINLAIQYELMDIGKNPYIKFKPKTEDVEQVCLMPDELERVERLTFAKPNLEWVRDMFLMQCYTGLRFSDISKISKSNIERTDKGLYLRFKAQKTKKNGLFPLHALFRVKEQSSSKPEAIVYKYLDKIAAIGKCPSLEKRPFFKFSQPHANRKLKEIAKQANINKNLTTHVGRRTFATLVALKTPPTILQKLMQHSTFKETSRYIQNNPLLLALELEKIDNW